MIIPTIFLISPIAFLIFILAIRYFGMVKCVKCGHKGFLYVNENSELECKKCGYNYGPE